MKALTLREVTILDMYVIEKKSYQQIAKRYRLNDSTIYYALTRVAQKLEVESSFRLCLYWCCPLFRLGLRELKLLPRSIK